MSEPSQAMARLISAEAIRDLIDRYARLLDMENFVEAGALFAHARIGAADCNGEALGTPVIGAEALLWQDRGRGVIRAKHFISDVRVQVSRDNTRATATSCAVVMCRAPRLALRVMHSSRNFDQLERCGSVWRFSQRLVWFDSMSGGAGACIAEIAGQGRAGP